MKKFPKLTVKRTSWKEQLWNLGGGKMDVNLYNTVNVEFEGRKKVEGITISHSFCPFCGEKLQE